MLDGAFRMFPDVAPDLDEGDPTWRTGGLWC